MEKRGRPERSNSSEQSPIPLFFVLLEDSLVSGHQDLEVGVG